MLRKIGGDNSEYATKLKVQAIKDFSLANRVMQNPRHKTQDIKMCLLLPFQREGICQLY